MKLLFAASPILGHVNPLLSIARMAKARGHDVILTTGSTFRAKIEQAGIPFSPLDAAADLDLSRIEEVYPERASLPPGPTQFRFDIERIFLDTMPAQASSLRRLLRDAASDLIIADSWFWGAKALFLDKTQSRVPIVNVGITFLSLDRPDGAPVGLGLPPASTDTDRHRYREIAADVDGVLTDPVKRYADSKLASMALPGLPSSFLPSCVLLADAFLQPTVPEFEYDFGQMPAHVKFVGPLPPPAYEGDVPVWWAELDGPHRLIMVTQGTAANHDFSHLIEPTIAAFADQEDSLVIVTTGGRPASSIRGILPLNVRVEEFLDYAAILPKVDVLITNGGYGTVCLALQAGLPIVAAGRTEDKPEVGARVAWSGAGVEIPSNNPSAAQIREAVSRVLDEPSFRKRAETIAMHMRARSAEETIFATLDDLVARR